jgi:asparagine synthase (glutamine-hydrolysing)
LLGGAARLTGSDKFSVRQAWLNAPSLINLYEESVYPKKGLNLLRSPASCQPELSHYPAQTVAMQLYDIESYMVDDILVKVDRASMAHSLESRIPLLDHRLAEYALAIPYAMNVENGVGKQVLRQLLYRYVPKEIVDRPKRGFAVPVASWLRGPLREWAESLVVADDPFLQQAMVAQLWQEHQSGLDRSRILWSVLMFRDWYHKVGCRGHVALSAA